MAYEKTYEEINAKLSRRGSGCNCRGSYCYSSRKGVEKAAGRLML